MPSMSRSFVSTCFAAASWASRLVPTGRVCVTVSVFWPESPRKLVFMNGVSAKVPTSTSTDSSRVVTECLRVQWMIGR